MRNLSTIRTISNIQPIPKADAIELAIVDGWQVVVKKGEFATGHKCLFFEIDSFLPASDTRFAFLGKPKSFGILSGYRLRTIKPRGALSQGLALPLTDFPEVLSNQSQPNFDELLSIVKWERSLNIASINKKLSGDFLPFPDFIPKTDQERIQNLPSYFANNRNILYEETLKLDGSSFTAYKVPGIPTAFESVIDTFRAIFRLTPIRRYHFGVCSRNRELPRNPDNQFWKLAIEANLEQSLPLNFAVQGELIAPNIQSNWEKVDKPELYIYDVYDIASSKYLLPSTRAAFMHSQPNLQHVPVLSTTPIFQSCTTIEALQTRVTGPSINPGTTSEGRVYKPVGGGPSFKCVSNAYLLKGGD